MKKKQREGRRKGRAERESGKKRKGKTGRGVLPSLRGDKRLEHDGGRCQVMCDKSKLKMT